MNDRVKPTFSTCEEATLEEISHRLGARGWAKHVTAQRLLSDWRELSMSVDRCEMTVDDYTNDLISRDGLEVVLSECPEPLCTKLRLSIEIADNQFLARTLEDVEHTLGQYFQIDQSSAWWWHRRPTAGPLAEYLKCPPPA